MGVVFKQIPKGCRSENGDAELRQSPGRHAEETAIRSESTGYDPLPTGRGQALILVLAGRFEPWHAGHHELVVKLLTSRGAGILPDDYARSLLARFPVARLHVAVAQISPLNAANPLEVGQ